MVKLTDYMEFNGIRVYYTKELDGGGAGFGQDYIEYVRANFPRQQRVFEWCSGPGFIGFSLLAHGLCDTLCLADINPLAVQACQKTIRENKLANKVKVHMSDNLKTFHHLKNGTWSSRILHILRIFAPKRQVLR